MLELNIGSLDLSRAKVAILWHWWLMTRFEVRREGDVKEVNVEFLIRCKLKYTGVICGRAGNIQEQSGIGKDSLVG